MSEKESGYNGWANYETWNVALWMDNEEWSYKRAREMAREAIEEADDDRAYASRRVSLADALKEWFEEANPLANDASVWSDLLSSALSEVDWREIATGLLEEIEEEEEIPSE